MPALKDLSVQLFALDCREEALDAIEEAVEIGSQQIAQPHSFPVFQWTSTLCQTYCLT